MIVFLLHPDYSFLFYYTRLIIIGGYIILLICDLKIALYFYETTGLDQELVINFSLILWGKFTSIFATKSIKDFA